MASEKAPARGWRHRLHEVIFEADTPTGKVFDVVLLLAIVASVIAVMLESVAEIRAEYGRALRRIEWTFTILFTVEYALRIVSVRRPTTYIFSFFGVVDLLSILPTYIAAVGGGQSLIVIRALRLLRVFRVLKLGHFVGEAAVLRAALWSSRRKILVFLGAVLTVVLNIGALMYLIEGEESGFTSIPTSIYWAIVTLTTVGYGDITPETVPGKCLASFVMICGFAIIAVPTGIVASEISIASQKSVSTQSCRDCGSEGHELDASYCRHCGEPL